MKMYWDTLKIGDGLYGLPAYCEVQCIGGNREFLEKAGIDWKSVQQNGWTYDEFREAIKKRCGRRERSNENLWIPVRMFRCNSKMTISVFL